MQDFRNLVVWRKAHELTLAVYRATAGFPAAERYGLTAHLRRSAVSAASNIAEGCGRKGDTDFARFVQIAMGSASELEYQLLLAHDLGFVELKDYQQLEDDVVEVKQMMTGLLQKLRAEG